MPVGKCNDGDFTLTTICQSSDHACTAIPNAPSGWFKCFCGPTSPNKENHDLYCYGTQVGSYNGYDYTIPNGPIHVWAYFASSSQSISLETCGATVAERSGFVVPTAQGNFPSCDLSRIEVSAGYPVFGTIVWDAPSTTEKAASPDASGSYVAPIVAALIIAGIFLLRKYFSRAQDTGTPKPTVYSKLPNEMEMGQTYQSYQSIN